MRTVKHFKILPPKRKHLINFNFSFHLAGRIVGAVCAMTGILVIAMPIPIIVNNFTRQYQRLKPACKFWEDFQEVEEGQSSGLTGEDSRGNSVIGLYSSSDFPDHNKNNTDGGDRNNVTMLNNHRPSISHHHNNCINHHDVPDIKFDMQHHSGDDDVGSFSNKSPIPDIENIDLEIGNHFNSYHHDGQQTKESDNLVHTTL